MGGTITQGIISALNKNNVGLNQYENFIQTDASINPGNSGGPVLAKIKDRIFVIGIVSKADGQATQGTFWVVPSTEIVSLKQRGGKIIDTLIFRR